jgi:hypothetical protein
MVPRFDVYIYPINTPKLPPLTGRIAIAQQRNTERAAVEREATAQTEQAPTTPATTALPESTLMMTDTSLTSSHESSLSQVHPLPALHLCWMSPTIPSRPPRSPFLLSRWGVMEQPEEPS